MSARRSPTVELVQSVERPPDYPSDLAETGAVCGVLTRAPGNDAFVSQGLAVMVVVIAAVAVKPARSLTRPAAFASNPRDRVDQRVRAGCCRAGFRQSTSPRAGYHCRRRSGGAWNRGEPVRGRGARRFPLSAPARANRRPPPRRGRANPGRTVGPVAACASRVARSVDNSVGWTTMHCVLNRPAYLRAVS